MTNSAVIASMSRSAATAASEHPYRRQHDEEFVSAQPGHGVLFTRPSLKPFCNFLQ
jgi:hypothetical protein